MRQFNTLTGFLLSKSANPATDDTVEFLGYAAIGDGGGATWKHNGVTGQTVSQSPGQLADALLNDASGNQWALVVSGAVNIRSLGAAGDGLVDDTLPIQSALNAGMEIRATSLSDPLFSTACYIPSGVYLLTAELYIDGDNFVFYGDGVGSSVLKRSTDYGNTLEVKRQRTVYPTGHLQYRITIRDFSIESTTLPTTGSHIESIASRWLKIQNVDFIGGAHRCIDLIGANRFLIQNVNFSADDDLYDSFTPSEGSAFIRALRNGLAAANYSSFHCEGVMFDCDTQITNSISAFYVCYDIQDADGIWLDSCYGKRAQYANYRVKPMDQETVNCGGIRSVNCWSDQSLSIGFSVEGTNNSKISTITLSCFRIWGGSSESTYGIVINSPQAENIKIDSCHISGNKRESIDIRDFNVDVSVTNCRVWDGNRSQSSAIPAIRVHANLDRFQLHNNTLAGSTSGGTGEETYGILIESGSSDDYMITGNDCSRGTSGVSTLVDGGTGINKVVANNLT